MNMFEKRKAMAGQGGFTLIELLVVIAILAVLGGAVIIGIGALRGNAEEQVCKTNIETIELAAVAWSTEDGNDINTLDGLFRWPQIPRSPPPGFRGGFAAWVCTGPLGSPERRGEPRHPAAVDRH